MRQRTDMRARVWAHVRVRAVVACMLAMACLLVPFAAVRAYAAEPTEVSVVEIALTDDGGNYLPKSADDSARFDLVAALGADGVTADSPLAKNAKGIEVTVEATVKTDGADPSSKVELLDAEGNVIGTATFSQKTDEGTGDPIDYQYVAVLDHVDTDPMDPAKEISEGSLGIKVTFKDTAGFELETDVADDQISDSDKSYELFGASVKEFDEGGTQVRKAYADGTFVIDRTAPELSGMQVQPSDGSASWSIANGASGKSGTVTIDLSATEESMDLSETRVLLMGVDDTSNIKLMTLSFDETTKQLTFEISDGHWDVAYRLVDAAGNVGSEGAFTNVTVDGTAPEVSFDFRGEDITGSTELHFEEGGQLVVTVQEPHFDKSKTTLHVWPSGAEVEFDFTYDEDEWTETSAGVYTYTIDFDYEGTFTVVFNSEDSLGNKRVGSETGSTVRFSIDGAPPVVTTQFVDSAGNEIASASTITSPLSAEVFGERVSVRVTISDHRLDLNSSTIALLGTSSVGKIPIGQFFGGADYPMMGTVLKTVSDENVDGNRVMVFDVTYPDDGVYNMPVMSAQDFTHDPVTSGPSESPHLLIDTKAPVLAARISEEPAGASELGTTAAGAAITNGEINGSGGLQNVVWFYKSGEAAQILLSINEPCGIKSIEVSDPSGRYDASDAAESTRQAGNANLSAAGRTTSFADLALADPLADGVDFSDNVTVKVTDFAGYSTIWTLANGLDTPGGETLYPTLLVEDDTDPTLTLTETVESKDVADAAGQNPGYVRYFNETKTVGATITDLTLKYLRGFGSGDEGDAYGDINGFYTGLDGMRPVITTIVNGDTANPAHVTIGEFDTENDGKTYKVSHDYDADGDYEVSLEVRDVLGNKVGDAIEKFTIDKTPPVFEVAYDNDTVFNGHYYKAPRTATITVTEHNFDPDLFEVTWTFADHAQGATEPTVTWDGATGDTHTCTVTFPSDGAYTLTVRGIDKAGNEAVVKGTTDTLYDSGTFVVDTEEPVIAPYYNDGEAPEDTFDTKDPAVELPPASGVYDGTNYYAHPISLFAIVQDRNFSEADTTVSVTKDGAKEARSLSWGRVPDERGANGYERYRTTVTFDEDGEYLAPLVDTTDLATNHAENEADAKKNAFVIDLKPPTVKVDVDRTPASQGRQGKGDDPVNFYNRATTMTFTVSDEHRLRSVKIDDPDSAYTVEASTTDAEGKGQVTFKVALKDGTVAKDNEYDRVIVLTAEDLAGNQRTWTIDHKGKILKDEEVDGSWKQVTSAADNVGINGGTQHPISLVQDTVAPVVSLSGVTAGTYYNTPQTVTASINELNLDWLKRFDPSRTVVTITKYEGRAGRAVSSWTIPASNFMGKKPNYTFAQAFSSDGHYVVEAQFRDFATNLSNKATIGEFTIDMTPPMLTMDFDNKDVRNGMYYKAPRTATITVTEHNFDPSLFTIETTGSIGSWSSNGDTHTITVYFGEGGPYTIRVNGKDLANNEATEVSEPEFIVDLTAPQVVIAGTAQRLGYVGDSSFVGPEGSGLVNAYHGDLHDKSAYNGVVVPLITYSDNEVLSANDLSFAMLGSKHGTDTTYETVTSPEDREMTVAFGDLGYQGEGAGDGSNWQDFYVDDYAVDADDIYTITASLTDQAGNEADATLTFSVNRYGSNYDVYLQDLSDEEKAEYEATGMLSAAPTIVVREVNVSGVDDRDRSGNLTGNNHHVEKEFANATTPIRMVQGEGLGYGLRAISRKRQVNGWSEYIYTVRSANFGEGSDSDHDDRGQGVYRVNVTSDDVSSNANTTAEFWRSDARRTQVTAAGATAEFILDELGPSIDDVDIPVHLSRGAVYQASFHVSDDITSGNTVEVTVDGKQLAPSAVQGPSSGTGTFTFDIPAKAFNWNRSVKIVVRDYAGREVSETNHSWMWQSTFIPEGALVAGIVAAIGAGIAIYRKRREAAEPELPL